MFSLHTQLAADTFEIGQLPLSTVLLMNNSSLPWLILVPRRHHICEWFELISDDQLQLLSESISVSQMMMSHFKGDKLNTGALGNLVPQLHLHHVVRFKSDPAWPAPVWGNLAPQPYSTSQSRETIKVLQTLLSQMEIGFDEKR